MKANKGFSLIELIVVILVLVIVAGAAVTFLQQGTTAYLRGKPTAMVAEKTNLAVDNLMREIESAESVTTIGTTGLTFVNQDGEVIVIDLSGTTLRRNVNAGGVQTLCTNVTALTFAYFTTGFATTAVAANVSFLTMTVTVTQDNVPYSMMAATVIRKKL